MSTLGVAMAVVPALALAEPRPTDGGLWSFQPTDVVELWDEPSGRVRVHFSVAGPSTTRLDDRDGDLVPDYPQQVARVTAEALQLWADTLELRAPLPEATVGDVLGGSGALDVYLVDFGGAADGRFGIDGCLGDEDRCAGFLVVENDFEGYGYATLSEAIATVASHESFHAVQAAYAELPSWMSEGTATWATHRFDPTLPDFVHACGGYLVDPGRPIYAPPPGPVPAFAYGSALWWDFLAARAGDGTVATVLESMDDTDGAVPPELVMADAIEASGESVADAWATFARYNLATGARAGAGPSHVYAAELAAITPDAEGTELDVAARLYPLAASYWRIDHGGGPLVFGCDAALADAVFSLHAIDGGGSDGAVRDALAVWTAPEPGAFVIPDAHDLAAGGWFIVATVPVLAESSAQARVCIGTEDHVAACGLHLPGAATEGSATGEDPTGTSFPHDDSGSSDSGSSDSESSDSESTFTPADADAGCACTSVPGREDRSGVVVLVLASMPAFAWRRRRAQ